MNLTPVQWLVVLILSAVILLRLYSSSSQLNENFYGGRRWRRRYGRRYRRGHYGLHPWYYPYPGYGYSYYPYYYGFPYNRRYFHYW